MWLQVAKSYGWSIAGLLFTWLVFVWLLVFGWFAAEWGARNRMVFLDRFRSRAFWPLFALWALHLGVSWFTFNRVVMFVTAIGIELSPAQFRGEMLLIGEGCMQMFVCACAALVCLTLRIVLPQVPRNRSKP
jgi:hypothetical protein